MREQSQKVATCGLSAALAIVIMVLGAVTGVGTYAAPMLAGLCLIPVGRKWGAKYQLTCYVAVSLLGLMLVADAEQNLMFIALLGWYPVLKPRLDKIPRSFRLPAKLLLFNVIIIAAEALVMFVLVPEVTGIPLLLVLLVLGNFVFLAYDFLIPRFTVVLDRFLHRIFRGHF